MRGALSVLERPAFPAAEGRKAIYLHPGEVFAAAEPSLVTTVLGSCIAVCLFDPFAAVGGMNHFLLPHPVAGDLASPRFGPAAIAELLRRLDALGARRGALVAKVFGGSCILEGPSAANAIGTKNVRVALRTLEEEGVPVRSEERRVGKECRSRWSPYH